MFPPPGGGGLRGGAKTIKIVNFMATGLGVFVFGWGSNDYRVKIH